MKHLFIAERKSFKSEKDFQRVLSEIKGCFADKEKDEYKIHITRYSRDSIAVIDRFISLLAEDETVRVYAVGGDGILFDCLNGMVVFPNAELACIPYGEETDFIRAYGHDSSKEFRNIKQMLDAPCQLIDIIHCGANYAMNNISFGLETQSAFLAESVFERVAWTKKFASVMYILCAIRAAFDKKTINQYFQIIVDGEDMSGNYGNISIGNSPSIGNGIIVNPYGKVNDGLLNAVFLRPANPIKVLTEIDLFTKGLAEKSVFLISKTFKEMEIRSDEEIKISLDYKKFYGKEIKIKLMPLAVKFVVPNGLELFDYSQTIKT